MKLLTNCLKETYPIPGGGLLDGSEIREPVVIEHGIKSGNDPSRIIRRRW